MAVTEERVEGGWRRSFWQQLEVDTTAREMHTRARENHAQAHVGHVVEHGGCNRAAKTSTNGWNNGEDPEMACQSCGGMKVYISGLEETRAEHYRRTGNGVAARGGKRPEGTN